MFAETTPAAHLDDLNLVAAADGGRQRHRASGAGRGEDQGRGETQAAGCHSIERDHRAFPFFGCIRVLPTRTTRRERQNGVIPTLTTEKDGGTASPCRSAQTRLPIRDPTEFPLQKVQERPDLARGRRDAADKGRRYRTAASRSSPGTRAAPESGDRRADRHRRANSAAGRCRARPAPRRAAGSESSARIRPWTGTEVRSPSASTKNQLCEGCSE